MVKTSESSTYQWVRKQVKQYTDKFSDYAILNTYLYRHFQHDINDDDTTPWKLYVPTRFRVQ